ncbi:MAG: pilin [Gammaproteobacteria bacterium]|nr:pilin [Gammaproteobacteria bacterium]
MSRGNRQGGFTLLELTIVMAVVSILLLLAIPLYIDSKTRAKISEGLGLVGPFKHAVMDFYRENGAWPNSNTQASLGLPASYAGENVSDIAIQAAGGSVQISYNIPALGANNTVLLDPTANAAGAVTWDCSGGTVEQKYRPPACR